MAYLTRRPTRALTHEDANCQDQDERALALNRRHRSALVLGEPAKAEHELVTLEDICLIPCVETDDLTRAIAAYIAGVFEALAKCPQAVRNRVRRSTVEEPNYRHRLLLRPRCERPRGRRAGEQRDELAAPCMSGKEHCEG